MENVEEQGLQNIRRVSPACKVECLEAAERKRILGVVKQESVLAAARPALQAVLELADDVGEAGNRSLLRLQHVHAVDRVPQLALLAELEPVTLFVALDEHAEEAEQELHVLFAGIERERVDGEVAGLLAYVQVRAAEDRG